MRKRLAGLALIVCLFGWLDTSLASDEKGGFIIGGGVGFLGCPQFLNAMATMRQSGGSNKIEGVKIISPFVMYVAGFRTGFNSEAQGIFDVFKALGEDAEVNALYAIEPWCAKNPDKNFATGLLVLGGTLRKNARQGQ
jgi:hypothetical protein